MDADLYMTPQSKGSKPFDVAKDFAALKKHSELKAPAADKTKLLYYINKLTGMHHLCILSSVMPDILAITYRRGYSGFIQCYKIISCS